MPDIHTWSGTAAEEEIQMMQERMKLFIFPNEAESEDEQAALEQAIEYQIAHEHTLQEQRGAIPDGASSFKIGDFSMTFEAGANQNGLNRNTICEAARSVLLRAGLLYRGLPREVTE